MRRRSFFTGAVGLAGLAATAEARQRPADAARIDLLRVHKRERVMLALSGDEVVMRFNVALGREPRGHKVREGDGRTPEGRYYIIAARPDSEFYRALKISYPNAEDRARARGLGVRPGGQIMIHGLDPAIGAEWKDRHWLFNWTNGCIAVTNAEMDLLWKSVAMGTPIEIMP